MDTERKIEKLLRAFAKKCREQTPDPSGLELHPATRRLFQSEVARRGQKPVEGNFFLKLFLGLRPRLALIVGVAVIAFVAASLLWPGSKPGRTELAGVRQELSKELPANKPFAPPAPPLPVTVASDSQRARRLSEEIPSGSAGGARPPADLPQPAAPMTPTLASGKAEREKAFGDYAAPSESRDQLKDQIARTTNALALGGIRPPTVYDVAGTTVADGEATNGKTDSFSPLPSQAVSVAANEGFSLDSARGQRMEEPRPAELDLREVTMETGAASPAVESGAALLFRNGATNPVVANRDPSVSRFYRVDADQKTKLGAASAAAEATPVLASFQLEQNGGQIRVVDEDGSVYSGTVEPSAPPTEPLRAVASPPVARKSAVTGSLAGAPAETQNARNYFFRVAGTNRSLNQRVVFTGNVVNETNQPVGAVAPNAVLQGRLGSQNTLDLRSRVSGRAVIDDRKEIEINAVPAAP